MRQSGKVGLEWQRTRRLWIKDNPPNHEGYYICSHCARWVLAEEIEVDHILSRSRRPDLRADQDNLQALCHKCNSRKGST